MIACLDVDYRNVVACAAGVTFWDWLDADTVDERVIYAGAVEPYAPGQFFRRELPCLLAILRALPPVRIVVVDGYVWLDGTTKAGLGAHLYQALAERVAVIGVAKARFRGAEGACEVIRGESKCPLFITAAGMETECAGEHIRSMHGCYRIPSLLARADYLCRHGQAVQDLNPKLRSGGVRRRVDGKTQSHEFGNQDRRMPETTD